MAFLLGLLGGLALGWLWLPAVLYERIEQPLSFNHALHTGEDVGLTCEECHSFRDDGSFTGIPGIENCMGCHEAPIGESKDEIELAGSYISKGLEIPWLVYSRQPENVYFSHAPHIHLAKLECRRCHGDHGTTETLRPFERNRLSTYSRDIWGHRISGGGPDPWSSMKMDDCEDCHKDKGVDDCCLNCHK
ncbi:MAG: cytochrome c family protein [Candidatus Eisenbacteria bacterium]|uniref:Cytochrome c family protein n=1 Tax=Eiseniibacteriota bacterium TaxID=2212470 RepID=A0A948RVX9_UNCEI|nr:cytochrome c family protein [Candidatus Eisenbacteria bacterium]